MEENKSDDGNDSPDDFDNGEAEDDQFERDDQPGLPDMSEITGKAAMGPFSDANDFLSGVPQGAHGEEGYLSRDYENQRIAGFDPNDAVGTKNIYSGMASSKVSQNVNDDSLILRQQRDSYINQFKK